MSLKYEPAAEPLLISPHPTPYTLPCPALPCSKLHTLHTYLKQRPPEIRNQGSNPGSLNKLVSENRMGPLPPETSETETLNLKPQNPNHRMDVFAKVNVNGATADPLFKYPPNPELNPRPKPT